MAYVESAGRPQLSAPRFRRKSMRASEAAVRRGLLLLATFASFVTWAGASCAPEQATRARTGNGGAGGAAAGGAGGGGGADGGTDAGAGGSSADAEAGGGDEGSGAGG